MRHYYAKQVTRARYFTDNEAWKLFRLAAFGEAFGWTLLISSILFKHYVTPTSNIPIEIAGQIHGTLFLIYIAGVFVLHPSLHWSPRRTLIAGLVSIPPYGTLVFEQWEAKQRHQATFQSYRQLSVRGLIINKGELCVVQPKENGFWYPPGGNVEANETIEQALKRTLTAQTTIQPVIGNLCYVWQHRKGRTSHLELFFMINNAQDYRRLKSYSHKRLGEDVDEIRFIKPHKNPDIRPPFLQQANFSRSSRRVMFV